MTSYNTDGSVGPWAKEKLECLQKYLNPYTTALKNKGFNCYYIDAFAGAGRAKLRASKSSSSPSLLNLIDDSPLTPDEEEYINGSPYIALSIKHPFLKYVFIEYNAANAQKLNHLKDEFRSLADRIEIFIGDANDILLKYIRNINWRSSRSVVFLDPFGMQVSWATIEALAKTKAIEVIINNPIPMAINRLLQKQGNITEDRIQMLNSYFGCETWKGVVYSETQDLFGETQKIKAENTSAQLGKFYNERLKKCFGHSASIRLVRNKAGTPIYYLHWAGPHPLGLQIADHVLAQGETI